MGPALLSPLSVTDGICLLIVVQRIFRLAKFDKTRANFLGLELSAPSGFKVQVNGDFIDATCPLAKEASGLIRSAWSVADAPETLTLHFAKNGSFTFFVDGEIIYCGRV